MLVIPLPEFDDLRALEFLCWNPGFYTGFPKIVAGQREVCAETDFHGNGIGFAFHGPEKNRNPRLGPLSGRTVHIQIPDQFQPFLDDFPP